MGVLLNFAAVTVKFTSKLLITLHDSALIVVSKCYSNHVLLFNFPYWGDDPKLLNIVPQLIRVGLKNCLTEFNLRGLLETLHRPHSCRAEAGRRGEDSA